MAMLYGHNQRVSFFRSILTNFTWGCLVIPRKILRISLDLIGVSLHQPHEQGSNVGNRIITIYLFPVCHILGTSGYHVWSMRFWRYHWACRPVPSGPFSQHRLPHVTEGHCHWSSHKGSESPPGNPSASCLSWKPVLRDMLMPWSKICFGVSMTPFFDMIM